VIICVAEPTQKKSRAMLITLEVMGMIIRVTSSGNSMSHRELELASSKIMSIMRDLSAVVNISTPAFVASAKFVPSGETCCCGIRSKTVNQKESSNPKLNVLS